MRLLSGMVAMMVLGACRMEPNRVLNSPQAFGSPLRAGDQVYLLTGQLNSRFEYPMDSDYARIAESYLCTDVWAFDANTTAPLWRKRLRTERNSAMANQHLLGAEGNVLWLLLREGLVAVSTATGDILADTDSIEAKNPDLKGLLPRERSYFSFGENGLRLRASDGREWRIDPQRFMAQGPRSISPAAIAPAYSAGNSTYVFQERGLSIPGRWLGLLTDQEAAQLREMGAVGDMDNESRRKLWGARVKPGSDPFRMRIIYTDLAPLGEEFLAPGLLSLSSRPLLLRNPDSVLILHQDRLGDERRLQLTRVSGPEGKTVWKTALPLSVLQSVMPGEQSLVLSGALFMPRKNSDRGEPLQLAHHLFVSVDLATGAVHSYDQNDIEHNPEAVPATRP